MSASDSELGTVQVPVVGRCPACGGAVYALEVTEGSALGAVLASAPCCGLAWRSVPGASLDSVDTLATLGAARCTPASTILLDQRGLAVTRWDRVERRGHVAVDLLLREP